MSSAEAVYDAWNNPGKSPAYHRALQRELRREWPSLAKALDALRKEDCGDQEEA